MHVDVAGDKISNPFLGQSALQFGSEIISRLRHRFLSREGKSASGRVGGPVPAAPSIQSSRGERSTSALRNCTASCSMQISRTLRPKSAEPLLGNPTDPQLLSRSNVYEKKQHEARFGSSTALFRSTSSGRRCNIRDVSASLACQLVPPSYS